MNPQKHARWVIAGIMLSVFLASMESTVVATAMPTIASELQGFGMYSWVFTAYLLTSTTLVPVFGKLSDLYGRRRIFAIAMAFFLLGSFLCGAAQSMQQLVWARAVQGVGAGGLLPIAFIMIGEMFSFEERARMQGLFSGVWGVSSVVGPLLGGFIVDVLSWPWVFWINLPLGAVAFALVWSSWRDMPRANSGPISVDYLGAVLLMASVVALMLGLQSGGGLNWTLVAVAGLLFVLLLFWEQRAKDPVLPIPLFGERLFTVAVAHGVLAGWAVFGAVTFVPLFVQGVIGTSATGAGVTLTPMLMAWVLSSIIGSRLLLRVDYKHLAVTGMVLLVVGTFLMTFAGPTTTRPMVMFSLGLMGTGMGLSVPAFLIAVQSTVQRSSLGTATSMLTFSRSIGGTLGVGVMGALLTASLTRSLLAAGSTVDPSAINGLLAGGEGGAVVAVDETLRVALAGGVSVVF
ncbi:MAG: MDR family MFS transporter, partial [Caldilineaceae bacterium]